MKTPILLGLLMISFAAYAFDAQGHRGARGLAPENTLAAFDQAMAIGVTTLELDVGLTSDGVPVISHDPYLAHDMVRDAKGEWLGTQSPLIRQRSLAELQSFDLGRVREGTTTARNFPGQQPRDGEKVPTLAALFARVKAVGADQIRFNIETKLNPTKPDETASPQELVKATLAVIQDAGMAGRVTIQSFDWRTLKLVQELAPAIPTAYLTVKSRNNDSAADPAWTAGMRLSDYPTVAHMVKAAGGAVWSPNFASINEAAVKSAQAIGVKVVPWTVNEPADMRRLISWGVDGIISDYPDRLRAAMQAAGMSLPAQIDLQRR
ncbi:MAG: glycerophosphodiester phosphodiesterase [Comamonadaceae bacterium]|nr:glycerophosphodiester phosphodiesterase [Comamonadaceae bacterium]